MNRNQQIGGQIMKIRSSEAEHAFQKALFAQIHAFSMQGLLMDSQGNFTACVEAMEIEPGDPVPPKPFPYAENRAKLLLAESIGVPLFYIKHSDGVFSIIEILHSGGKIVSRKALRTDGDGFAQWWREYKKMPQSKPLDNGGEPRLVETVFDRVLREHGLEWGGNIDGFVVDADFSRVTCIIDNISSKGELTNERADPARYLTSPNPKHGPRYKSWLGPVTLAQKLGVPHALFTVDKTNRTAEHIGLAFIASLSHAALRYAGDPPFRNVLSGKAHIAEVFAEQLAQAQPPRVLD